MRTARIQTSLSDVKRSSGDSKAADAGLRASSTTNTPEVPQWIERARPRLPLKVTRVAGQRQPAAVRLSTRDISSSGVFFLCPERIEPGTPIEIEVALVDRPHQRGSVQMITEAHIVRAEAPRANGWHGLAAIFDDITFQRNDPLPPRFHNA